MQKCSLCGGRVVNGRCEECGLPIPPEHTYTLRGESAHYHRVNGEDVLHRVRPQGGRPDVEGYAEEERTAHVHESGSDRHEAPRPTVRTPPYRENAAPKPPLRGVFTACFILIMVLAVLLPMLLPYLSRLHYPGGGGFIHDSTTEIAQSAETDSYDPYEELRGLMPADGTAWDGTLTAGFYTVGQDLPAGSYTIQCTDDATGISMEYVNEDHAVWAYENFYGYDGDFCVQTDIPMPDGTKFFLDGPGALSFHTENVPGTALPASTVNPNTTTYVFSAAAEADTAEYTVGEDITPGVYDVIVTAGDSGYFSFEYPTEITGTMYCGAFLCDSEGQNTLQHIVLQPGTTVSVRSYGQYDFEVELHPTSYVYE